MKIYRLSEDTSYRINHTAPSPENGASMDKITDIYPDDIYGRDAIRNYGDRYPFDSVAIYIIQSARNSPNKNVKIYRAVPYDNEKKKEANEIWKLTKYFNKYEFFPRGNELIDSIRDRLGDLEYNEQQKKIYEELVRMGDEIENSIEDINEINSGDWVSLSREYAKMHGLSMFGDNHKILSKTVKAINLYTDGNSIHEWGYWR